MKEHVFALFDITDIVAYICRYLQHDTDTVLNFINLCKCHNM